MERFDVAVEVGPIAPPVVERLKDDGHTVYQGKRTWRVITTVPVDPARSVREHASDVAANLIIDYRLDPLHTPPTVVVRDPDAIYDVAAAELILEDARRASDPDPLTRHKRRWWQKQMELGLGERKGD